MLNVSCAFSWESDVSRAFFVLSRGVPFMLALISTINTTSFLKTYQVTERSIINTLEKKRQHDMKFETGMHL